MAGFRFRLIDTDGSEIGIVTHVPNVREGDTIHVPGGRGSVTVLEVYDDEHGQEGSVQATLVVDDTK